MPNPPPGMEWPNTPVLVDIVWVKSSFSGKDLVVPMDTKLKKSLHCALAAKTTNYLLGWVRKNVSRSWKVILLLCSALVRHVYCVWALKDSDKRDVHIANGFLQRIVKIFKVQEQILYKEWLRQLGLFGLEKMHSIFSKCINTWQREKRRWRQTLVCGAMTGLSRHNGEEAQTKIQ